MVQEDHQASDLVLGTVPVLSGKGEQSKVWDSKTGAVLHDLSNSIDPSPMTGDAREAAIGGPPSVAVHNNGDMGGKIVIHLMITS
jgi:hypothetical protein